MSETDDPEPQYSSDELHEAARALLGREMPKSIVILPRQALEQRARSVTSCAWYKQAIIEAMRHCAANPCEHHRRLLTCNFCGASESIVTRVLTQDTVLRECADAHAFECACGRVASHYYMRPGGSRIYCPPCVPKVQVENGSFVVDPAYYNVTEIIESTTDLDTLFGVDRTTLSGRVAFPT